MKVNNFPLNHTLKRFQDKTKGGVIKHSSPAANKSNERCNVAYIFSTVLFHSNRDLAPMKIHSKESCERIVNVNVREMLME